MLVPPTSQPIWTPISWEQRLLGRSNGGRLRRSCCLSLRGIRQPASLPPTMWMALLWSASFGWTLAGWAPFVSETTLLSWILPIRVIGLVDLTYSDCIVIGVNKHHHYNEFQHFTASFEPNYKTSRDTASITCVFNDSGILLC